LVADGVGSVVIVALAVAEEVALADAVDVLVEMADAVAEDEADRVMVEVLVAGSNGKKATDTLMSEGDCPMLDANELTKEGEMSVLASLTLSTFDALGLKLAIIILTLSDEI